MKSPNPSCELECRFRDHGGMTTLAYYPPIYDKHGNNVNPDRNVTSGVISCLTCKAQWNYSTCLGETEYTKLEEARQVF